MNLVDLLQCCFDVYYFFFGFFGVASGHRCRSLPVKPKQAHDVSLTTQDGTVLPQLIRTDTVSFPHQSPRIVDGSSFTSPETPHLSQTVVVVWGLGFID